jgi:hypothetical protein
MCCSRGDPGNGQCYVSCTFSAADASVAPPGTSGDALSSTLDSGPDLVLMSSMDSASEVSVIDSADIEAGGEAGRID